METEEVKWAKQRDVGLSGAEDSAPFWLLFQTTAPSTLQSAESETTRLPKPLHFA